MAKKLIHGVGINDSGYAVRGRSPSPACDFYKTWKSVITRCYSQSYHETNPTYRGCKVGDSWLKFSNFKRWMERQDWHGKELDKDLLGDGKLYSPKTCVFVSPAVNMFVVRGVGILPCGVTKLSSTGKYQSQVRMVGGARKYLGCFYTPEEAHQAWRKAKRELCLELIKLQTCPRTRRGLRRWMCHNLN